MKNVIILLALILVACAGPKGAPGMNGAKGDKGDTGSPGVPGTSCVAVAIPDGAAIYCGDNAPVIVKLTESKETHSENAHVKCEKRD